MSEIKSIWSDTSYMPEFPRLEEDVKTDVLIIGGGIAGILTAYFLKQSGADVILAEKGRICSGTTKNTTAKITFQHGLIYKKLTDSLGVEKAGMYLEANRKAAEKYAELCRNIDCDYEVRDNYVYSVSDRARLEEEILALDKIGYKAEFCEGLLPPIWTAGAVKFPNQAQFNPLKFLSFVAEGLPIYENTFVREMIGNTALTDRAKINADRVVVTTHFPFINKHGSYFLKLYQHRSYFIALENAPDLDGMYVDEAQTGFSFRNYGNYLLIGGNGHRTGKPSDGWKELRGFAERYYPDLQEKYCWAAQDCMSLDGIPYIGRYSGSTKNLYVASGFGKWGMTGSMTAATLLSDMIIGNRNDCAEIFDPSRSILKPQLFANGFEAVKNLLTFTEKRCPHLGCALKWNKAERSWDCPCHGSRFDEVGKILDNPANGDLKI